MRQTCLKTVELQKNNNIVFIGSDLGPGVLDDFKKNSLIGFSWRVYLNNQ